MRRKTLFKRLDEQEILKGLLYESGKALELAVIQALRLLGYKAENYDDGTLEIDQVILSPEGKRFIGECEGKDAKAIDIGKFRQLSDALNEDFQRDEVEEKAFGILFGNAQRLVPVEERKSAFTKKCLIGAKRELIVLIRTQDLFPVAKYLLENTNESFKAEMRQAIESSLGDIVIFPPVPE